MEIERIGYRPCSLPFDWLITSNFDVVMNCIEDGFAEFLNYYNLQQESAINPSYYYDCKNQMHFYHDFDYAKPLIMQMEFVKEKYERRIKRFYSIITKPSLFIRYCYSLKEIQYVNDNHERIEKILKKFNPYNSILYIYDTPFEWNQHISSFYVKPDRNDSASRKFILNNPKIQKYIKNHVCISHIMKIKNLLRYRKKKILRFPKRIILKICKVLNIKQSKPYVHDKQYIK